MKRRLSEIEIDPIAGSPWCAILLRSGHIALLDAADLPLIDGYSLFYDKPPRNRYGYVSAMQHGPHSQRRRTRLHNLIMPGGMVDHINRDGLDCRRINLRLTNHSLNGANRSVPRNSSSGFKGVHPSPKGRWRARLSKRCSLGTYATKEEAARAYDRAAFKLWGEHACLNLLGEVHQ